MTSTGPGDRSVVSVAVDDTPWCATGAELVADRLFALGASAVSELVDSDGAGTRLVGDLPSSALGELTESGLVFEVLEVDPTWNHQWREHATVVVVGARLALRPEWLADRDGEHGLGGGSAGSGDVGQHDGDGGDGQHDGDAVDGDGIAGGRIEVVLDAADAFGSGSHATTRLCLLALEQLDSARRDVDAERPDVDRQSGGRQSGGRQPASRQKSRPLDARPPDGATTQRGLSGARVLDVGSGTGVLGVAALLLDSSASLVAVDVDPAAIAATRRTAELNAVDERLIEVSRRSVGDVSTEHGPFDVVFANLLIPIIEELGPSLAAALAPGAHLVMSGLLSDPETGQVGRAIGAVQGARLEVAGVHEAQGWAAVVFRRTVPAI